ncbi:MAG TPA: type IV pilus biogenesis/stability protein PilW [Marinagarivorans sp.]
MKVIISTLGALLLAGCVSSGVTKTSRVDPAKAMDTRIELGMKYLDAGNRDQALRQFLDVLEIDKKNPEGLQGLALVHQLNGEPEEAEENFLKSIKYANDKQISSSRYTYGLFLSRQGRYEKAAEQFEEVAKDLAYPERASSLYFAGRCALELGNKDRAKAAFTHALNLRPKLAPPAIELADLAFQEQDYATAKRYLDRYNKLSEPSARSLWLGIRIERIFGNKDRVSSQALALKNMFGYSNEYLQYKALIESQ